MDFETLEALFISDPSRAIEASQNIIVSISEFDSYQDFYSYHLKNAHMSTCQTEWTETQVCIYCRDCGVLTESCICVPCFLNGNHEGHQYVINKTRGNCDCGDPIHWKKCGFCSKHHGLADNECPENYLDEKLRTTLTDLIFKAAFMSLKHFTTDHSENATHILQFVSSFLKFGDGFRRLISISLTERFDLEDLMQGLVEYSSVFNSSLQQLCGGLVNDQLFIRNFSKISFNIIENKIVQDTPTIMSKGKEAVSYGVWNRFWFHCFSSHCMRYSIEKFNWDWVKFGTNTISYFKELFKFVKDSSYTDLPSLLNTIANRMRKASDIQPNEETQHFFDNLMNKILSCGSLGTEDNKNDTIIVDSFLNCTDRFDYFSVFHFKICFYLVFKAFKNKPTLKLDSLFDQLDKLTDMSEIFLIGLNSIDVRKSEENENDKFVSRFFEQKEISDKNDSNYKSFHNGASFFFSFPLYESLVTLFRMDELCRVKIARLFSLKKFQNLRVKLGIVTLKSILSFICNKQCIVPTINEGLDLVHAILNKTDMASYSYNKFVPIFQLLIGLHGEENSANDEFGLKEFFAFELARELGIFDDFAGYDYEDENVSEKQKQMFFSFLYLSLLLVVERNLYHFDGNEFVREQIIFSLKKGIHSIDQLDQLNDYSPTEDSDSSLIFNDILMSVADTLKKTETTEEEEKNDENSPLKSNKQESLFYLKDNIEFNNISAINPINDQMAIMNNSISKEPSKLLSLPTFESEETFFFKATQNNNVDNNNELKINLKQFLFTPTVLAIVYHSLRNPSQSSQLNEHLSMNILILISKFINEDHQPNSANCSLNEIHYDDLADFIFKLKRIAFNYHIDENGNAIIESTLNKETFVSLLKMKISSNDLEPKSFIDVLLEKGKLGHDVLHQMSSYVHTDSIEKKEDESSTKSENSEKDIKVENRKKANKLKADIMNHYKDMIANYNQRGSDSIDAISSVSNSAPFGVDKEVCSICSTYKKDQVFTYPLYLYRTKFPFIIDKPPKVSKDSEGRAIDDIADDYETFDIEEEEEGENEDDIDKEQMIQAILESFPEFANNEGLDEEQLAERRNFIDAIYRSLAEDIVNEKLAKKKTKKYSHILKKYQRKEHEKYLKQMETKEFKRCSAGANYVLQFNLCQHSVHPDCVKDIPFTCPIDRSKKNCLLPSLDMIPKTVIFKDLNSFELNEDLPLSKSAIVSIRSFCLTFVSFFDLKGDIVQCTLIELIKSISSLISTFEIRLRSLPDCLDSEKNILLARNLFLTAWYSYRIYEKPEIEEEQRMTLFQRLIKALIESDEIETQEDKKEEIFKKIVSDFIDNNEDEKLICLFLRRCCLAQHFLLDIDASSNSIVNLIDWDEILSPSNLSLLYNVKFKTIDVDKGDEFEFKPFTFLSLPKEFLRLYLSPFKLQIEQITKVHMFSLFDYNYLINHYDEMSGEVVLDSPEVEEEKNLSNLQSCEAESMRQFLITFYTSRMSPSVILFIGKFASKVILINSSLSANLDTFYLDKYGCTDIDYKRSQPLFLNEEKLEKLVDVVLSGEFANSFNFDFNE